MTNHVEREMTISRNEFLRLLPVALAKFDYELDGNSISFGLAQGNAVIKLKRETERKIASLRLPVLYVEFRFDMVPEKRQQELLQHFFKIYQRGGG